VRAVVAGVAAGVSTISDLSKRTSLSARHVRYYLLAAETLEWVALGQRQVTDRGRYLLSLRPYTKEEAEAIASAISVSTAIRETVGNYLREEVDRADLTDRLLKTTSLSRATAARRAECLLAWRSQLEAAGWTPEPIPSHNEAESMPFLGILSVRAQNVLERLGVRSKEGLTRVSRAMLQSSPNCGRRTIREIVYPFGESHS
jgi:hypothetical protein